MTMDPLIMKSHWYSWGHQGSNNHVGCAWYSDLSAYPPLRCGPAKKIVETWIVRAFFWFECQSTHDCFKRKPKLKPKLMPKTVKNCHGIHKTVHYSCMYGTTTPHNSRKRRMLILLFQGSKLSPSTNYTVALSFHQRTRLIINQHHQPACRPFDAPNELQLRLPKARSKNPLRRSTNPSMKTRSPSSYLTWTNPKRRLLELSTTRGRRPPNASLGHRSTRMPFIEPPKSPRNLPRPIKKAKSTPHQVKLRIPTFSPKTTLPRATWTAAFLSLLLVHLVLVLRFLLR